MRGIRCLTYYITTHGHLFPYYHYTAGYCMLFYSIRFNSMLFYANQFEHILPIHIAIDSPHRLHSTPSPPPRLPAPGVVCCMNPWGGKAIQHTLKFFGQLTLPPILRQHYVSLSGTPALQGGDPRAAPGWIAGAGYQSIDSQLCPRTGVVIPLMLTLWQHSGAVQSVNSYLPISGTPPYYLRRGSVSPRVGLLDINQLKVELPTRERTRNQVAFTFTFPRARGGRAPANGIGLDYIALITLVETNKKQKQHTAGVFVCFFFKNRNTSLYISIQVKGKDTENGQGHG